MPPFREKTGGFFIGNPYEDAACSFLLTQTLPMLLYFPTEEFHPGPNSNDRTSHRLVSIEIFTSHFRLDIPIGVHEHPAKCRRSCRLPEIREDFGTVKRALLH